MPYCPRCGTAYREGFSRCADCGVPLVDEPPSALAVRSPEPVQEVAVASFVSRVEAEMWAELLAEEGIPCVIVPLGPGAGGWGSSEWLPHELRVRAEDEERASGVLREDADPHGG